MLIRKRQLNRSYNILDVLIKSSMCLECLSIKQFMLTTCYRYKTQVSQLAAKANNDHAD